MAKSQSPYESRGRKRWNFWMATSDTSLNPLTKVGVGKENRMAQPCVLRQSQSPYESRGRKSRKRNDGRQKACLNPLTKVGVGKERTAVRGSSPPGLNPLTKVGVGKVEEASERELLASQSPYESRGRKRLPGLVGKIQRGKSQSPYESRGRKRYED